MNWSYFYFLIFLLFRSAPLAYGASQPRSPIRATAAGLYHSTAMPDPSCVSDPQHSSWQRLILNPLFEARDQTWILLDPGWFVNRQATMGTTKLILIIHNLFSSWWRDISYLEPYIYMKYFYWYHLMRIWRKLEMLQATYRDE